MVLVDTSVWIRFAANRHPEAAALDRLLESGEVFGHEFVFGELLIGDRGGRGTLLVDYAFLPKATMVPHAEGVDFVRRRGLYGRGVGWIGIHLLTSALVDGLRLWTADSGLVVLAQQIGVAYELPT